MPVSTTVSTDYFILTECGRRFVWGATSEESLLRELTQKGYRATYINELSEYEAEIAAKEAQEDLIYQWQLELEREMKESA